MASKRKEATRRRRRTTRTREHQEPRGHVLVHPSIVALSHYFASRPKTKQVPARLYPDGWRPIPDALLPFIRSADLTTLPELLRRRRDLYWHPVVCAQIAYLVHLCEDHKLWERLGWAPRIEHDGTEWPPKETDHVRRELQSLLIAHVQALLPGSTVADERVKQRPGPKAGIENPHPLKYRHSSGELVVDEATRFIDAATLHDSCRHLGSFFRGRVRDLVGPPAKVDPRLAQLVRSALDDVGPRWSGLREGYFTAPPPAHFSRLPRNQRRGWAIQHLADRWHVDADHIVAAFRASRKHLPKAGNPARLAYAVLGDLLDVSPERVRNTVDQYERARR